MQKYQHRYKLHQYLKYARQWCFALAYKGKLYTLLDDGRIVKNENIIIMCKHGAIFNGTYCNGVWFCMDGYINDIYKDSPIYTSMSSIPPLWEPVAWMPIPSFDDIFEANKDVLERLK